MTTKNTEQTPDGMRGFFVRVGRLDRRWIFLAMGLSIAVPILLKLRFPEVPGPMARATFDAIELLPDGSRVLLSFDFDPASKAELQPMANALVHHCASKGHKIVFMALWPLGKQMADQAIKEVLLEYHGDKYEYGADYVQLGFKAGNEGVIKVLTTNVAEAYPTDASGAAVSGLPLVADARDLGSFDLVSTVSAGYPGAKEWVQYGREAIMARFPRMISAIMRRCATSCGPMRMRPCSSRSGLRSTGYFSVTSVSYSAAPFTATRRPFSCAG